MAVIKCDDFGLGVSSTADYCPHCGSKDFDRHKKSCSIIRS